MEITCSNTVSKTVPLPPSLEDEKPRLEATSCDCGAVEQELKHLELLLECLGEAVNSLRAKLKDQP